MLVDSIVTDKKGNYVRDLEEKDFKVWEDGKEQAITSFSYEENTGSTPAAKIRYMVYFSITPAWVRRPGERPRSGNQIH